jgi:hypothetical protein
MCSLTFAGAGEELEVAGMAPASSVITPQTAGAREEE